MKVTIYPSKCQGSLSMPPSKSLTHRYLIATTLSKQKATIKNIYLSKDILATLDVLSKLNCDYQVKGAHLLVDATETFAINANDFYIEESASTLRFLLPLLSFLDETVVIKLGERLAERPINEYRRIWKKQGLKWKMKDRTINIAGKLKAGKYKVAGDISSQFISGLLFALPLLDKPSQIIVTTKIESTSYIRLTLQILKEFGINVDFDEKDKFNIPAPQTYQLPKTIRIDADFSQSANFLVLAAINSTLKLNNLPIDTLQGDAKILQIIEDKKGSLTYTDSSIEVKTTTLEGSQIDLSDCPDLAPIICVLAALSKDKTTLINTSRLRYKESNRLEAMRKEFHKLGIKIKINKNSAVIFPWDKKLIKSTILDSHSDHRVLMALSILATVSPKPITISNYEVVAKSFPSFFLDLSKIGIKSAFTE